MKLDLESFLLRLKNWLWKGEREDDEMSRGYRRISTYFTTQGIHQDIRSHELATQGNPQRDKKQRTHHSKKSIKEIRE